MAEFIRFTERLVSSEFRYAFALSAADLTGSGSLDLVATDADRGLYWFENDGAGTFTRHVVHLRTNELLERHAVADVDGDGQVEVVATAWGDRGRVALFKHRGDPRGSWDMQILKDNWAHANMVIVADLDGDGRLDVAACAERGSNELRWWRNEGPATGRVPVRRLRPWVLPPLEWVKVKPMSARARSPAL